MHPHPQYNFKTRVAGLRSDERLTCRRIALYAFVATWWAGLALWVIEELTR